jgi:hypothetical protein
MLEKRLQTGEQRVSFRLSVLTLVMLPLKSHDSRIMRAPVAPLMLVPRLVVQTPGSTSLMQISQRFEHAGSSIHAILPLAAWLLNIGGTALLLRKRSFPIQRDD